MVASRVVVVSVVLALAGCGRLGFGNVPDGGSSGDGALTDGAGPSADAAVGEITLTVVTEQGSAVTAGQPVAGADILIEHADGTLGRGLTDAAGVAHLPAGAPLTFDVLFLQSSGEWRLYTVENATPGATITLGGRGALATSSMTFDLGTGSAGDEFAVHGPAKCNFNGNSDVGMVVATYDPSCDGETFDLTAEFDHGVVASMDLGDTVLTNGGAINATGGTYATATTATVMFSALPPSGTTVLAAGALLGGGSYEDVVSTGSAQGVSGGSATVTIPITAATDAIDAEIVTPDPLSGGTFALLPSSTIAGGASITGAELAPVFTAVTLGADGRSLAWTGGGGGTLVAFDAVIIGDTEVAWTAYLDPATTTRALPTFPTDLAAADPGLHGSLVNVMVHSLHVPGATAMTLLAGADPMAYPLRFASIPDTGYSFATANPPSQAIMDRHPTSSQQVEQAVTARELDLIPQRAERAAQVRVEALGGKRGVQ